MSPVPLWFPESFFPGSSAGAGCSTVDLLSGLGDAELIRFRMCSLQVRAGLELRVGSLLHGFGDHLERIVFAQSFLQSGDGLLPQSPSTVAPFSHLQCCACGTSGPTRYLRPSWMASLSKLWIRLRYWGCFSMRNLALMVPCKSWEARCARQPVIWGGLLMLRV